MQTADRMTRTERAKLFGLTLDGRVTSNEADLDTLDDRLEEVAIAIRFQTRAIISGLVGVILALIGLGILK